MSYTICMKNLNTRQKSFVKHIASGNNATQAAILSGYSKKSARFTASKLLTNGNISQQLDEIFNKAGLSDEQLVDRLKTTIDAGVGKKATNGDALKGLRMIFELKNKFPSPQLKAELTQEDEHMVKLQHMSNEELIAHMEQTALKTKEVLERMKQRRFKAQNGDDNKQSVIPPVKLTQVESISDVMPVITEPASEDTNIRRAVGIPVEVRIIKQPVLRPNTESESSEDKHFQQKVSYPA